MDSMQRENYSEVVCRYCGKHFLLLNSRIRRGNGKFCSKKCAGKDKTKKITRICPTCGKSFLVFAYKIKEGKGKFCSLTQTRTQKAKKGGQNDSKKR